MPTTMEVGKKLVELCQQGKFEEAVEKLYSPKIVSIEAGSPGPQSPRRQEGIEAIRKKGKWWQENHTIHGGKVEGPWPHDDRFIARFTFDVTPKAGPMAGKRFTMDETGLYTVKDGKVVQEEFFYHMG
jgi:hypothetical protein